jgi:hypothetical protein
MVEEGKDRKWLLRSRKRGGVFKEVEEAEATNRQQRVKAEEGEEEDVD